MDEYQEDVGKIVRVYQKRGIEITEEQAVELWERYSDSLFASWMMMPDDLDAIFETTKEFAEEMGLISPE